MDKPKQKFSNHLSEFLSEDKKAYRKNILLGSVIAVIIASSPFLFYLYESVPSDPVWHTFLFTYHSGFYENAQTAMWMLSGKLIPLLFLTLWFFTCRHWWYHALLVPIIMYVYQIFVAIQQDVSTRMDEFDLIYLLPIMAIIIPSIYLIRAKMFDKINDADKTVQDLEDEFRVSPKGFWERIRQYF